VKLRMMEERHKQDMDAMREEMNKQFGQIMSMIQLDIIIAKAVLCLMHLAGSKA
jgi:hypothetical protein